MELSLYTLLEPQNALFPHQRHTKQAKEFCTDADCKSNSSNRLALQMQGKRWEKERRAEEYAGKSDQKKPCLGAWLKTLKESFHWLDYNTEIFVPNCITIQKYVVLRCRVASKVPKSLFWRLNCRFAIPKTPLRIRFRRKVVYLLTAFSQYRYFTALSEQMQVACGVYIVARAIIFPATVHFILSVNPPTTTSFSFLFRTPFTMTKSSKPRFADAESHLTKADPVMKRLIGERGHCTLKPHNDTFYILCDSIISQQLSVKASATILKRFCSLFPKETPTPELVLKLDDEDIRAVGCSNAKVRYVKDLATKFLDGTLKPKQFSQLDDEDLIKTLVQVKGIGRWTAEMYLIFSLNRLNVMAVDDLGLRKAMMQLYDLPAMPKPSEMLAIAEKWHPYRSIASWYLWRSLDNA